MPEIVMSQSESSVTCPTDVTNRIRELTECMDNADVIPDGFSDSDESFENESAVYQPVSKHTQEVIHTEKRLLHTLGLKNGLFERRVPMKVYKSKKSEDKFDQHSNVRPKSTGTTSSNSKLKRQISEEKVRRRDSHNDKEHPNDVTHNKNKKTDTEKSDNSQKANHPAAHHHHGKTHGKHHQHHHHNHHHHHHHHGNTHGKDHHEKSGHGKSHNEKGQRDQVHASKDDTDNDSIDSDLFDSIFFETILAGQSKDNLHVPIMSPPPEESTEFQRNSSSYYTRPMSFKFLLAGETLPCNFDDDKNKEAAGALLLGPSKDTNPICFCSSCNPYDDSFTGWEAPQKGTKAKIGRRKKSLKPGSSDITFNRLTQTMGKDPVIFQHYKDNSKYIERYRFYHTVGNVGRPISYSKFAEKGVESDPYYSRMKSNLTSAMTSHFYGLTSQLRDEKIGSASSAGSAHEKPRSDDESIEDSSVDARPYSMRDRGKALNLAPVRECTVPCLRPTDKVDITQLNKYLNLSTPPVPNNCLQFNFDEAKAKRLGNAHENMFPASNSRRVARTLRLGSAEFVKPGTPDSVSKWNSEKRNLHRSSLTVSNSMPGNLIVGSTVSSPIPFQTARVKSGGNRSPYVQFQNEHSLNPSTPPHHVSGQGFKACERVSEVSGKDRGRFGYTHAAHGAKTPPIVRTATAVDFKETYIPSNRPRTITLDVNHLGIRGQQYKQREQIVLYKNRRAQIAKS